MYLVKIKNTIWNGFQLIQYVTAINTVTITKINMNSPPLLRPIIKIGICRPIKFLTGKIITNPGYNPQYFISGKQPVVLKILPPGEAVTTTITQQ